MIAAALVDVGRFEMRDVSRASPGPHDAVVRVTAVGLCGTDLHIVAGHANYNRDERGRAVPLTEEPQILGHEITGVIEEVGAEVGDLRVGDRVVLDQGINCRSRRRIPPCEYCTTGDSHQCEFYREHGIAGLPGGFAEYVVLPAVNAVRVESGLEHSHAALTEPLACVLHAASLLDRVPARYHLRSLETLVIFGAGPAGLLFVQLLRRVLAFDGDIIVSEPNPAKRALAERFGAATFDPLTSSIVDAVADRSDGRRAELAIDASGSGDVFNVIPGVLRKQGTLLLYGHGHGGVDMSLLNAVQFLEPTVLSPVGASGGFEHDGRPSIYIQALRHIEKGTVDVGSLISHRYDSLASIPKAFAGDHRAADYVKGVIIL